VLGIARNGYRSYETAVKLVDVPELSYFSTDKPYPRGELWVKTANTILGYFKDKENTDKNFDSDGYFCTGDIVEYDKETGKLNVIDRRKNIIKLSQGAFIA
jgi:fatty acid CoA ligase FadD9